MKRNATKKRKADGWTAERDRRYRDRALWSVTEFVREFGVSADTVAKRVRAARLEPQVVNGAARFAISALVEAVFLRDAGGKAALDQLVIRRAAELFAVVMRACAAG